MDRRISVSCNRLTFPRLLLRLWPFSLLRRKNDDSDFPLFSPPIVPVPFCSCRNNYCTVYYLRNANDNCTLLDSYFFGRVELSRGDLFCARLVRYDPLFDLIGRGGGVVGSEGVHSECLQEHKNQIELEVIRYCHLSPQTYIA